MEVIGDENSMDTARTFDSATRSTGPKVRVFVDDNSDCKGKARIGQL